jgi:hypothetical protein
LELADLTKYILSLWEHNGFSLDELLYYTSKKTHMVGTQWEMDFIELPSDWPILIVDVDGTLGDYRTALLDWLSLEHDMLEDEIDQASSLLFDVDMEIAYPVYYPLKEEFEAAGGYGWLPPYHDAIDLVQELKRELDLVVIIYTARPAGRYKYIWLDTLKWLEQFGIYPSQLHIGGAERVLLASKLQEEGRKVVMLEDNPDLIHRANAAGIPVLGRLHKYNSGLGGLHMVELVTDFLQFKDTVKGWLK